jgi:hypothetical protein
MRLAEIVSIPKCRFIDPSGCRRQLLQRTITIVEASFQRSF